MPPEPKISVVIATYNRSSLLRGALESLSRQTLDPQLFDTLVVENNCTDDTASVVEDFAAAHPELSVRVMSSDAQGAGHTRNVGVQQTRGKYLGFLDDDAKAGGDWLTNALRDFETITPPPAAVGGPILPFYVSPKPSWFEDEYELRTWGDEPRFLQPGEPFSASNMFITRKLFDSVGGFATHVGPRGNQIGTGDETLLFDRIWEADPDAHLYYDPSVAVEHLVPGAKMTVRYILKREFAAGQSWYDAHEPGSFRGRVWCARSESREAVRLLASAIRSIRHYRDRRKWAYERLRDATRHLGMVFRSLGFRMGMQRH